MTTLIWMAIRAGVLPAEEGPARLGLARVPDPMDRSGRVAALKRLVKFGKERVRTRLECERRMETEEEPAEPLVKDDGEDT